jgi:3'-phosphoadenosine 5'-phosphosulfate sulfotransferase (PAPS reductase)/FAD synthetase
MVTDVPQCARVGELVSLRLYSACIRTPDKPPENIHADTCYEFKPTTAFRDYV